MIGKSYKKWCSLDEEDTRKINYEIMYKGKIIHTTSEDYVEPFLFRFVQEATIQFLKLFHNEWYVILR